MSNDDPNEREDSTKQVDRAALNAALNRSVDSQKILQRVNAEAQEESHAEGTAQIDHDAVKRYIEAARSGEFPSIDSIENPSADGPVEGKVPESAEILAESSESVYESPERDTTGPKAAIFRRTPSKGAKALPKSLKLPPPPSLPSASGAAATPAAATAVAEAESAPAVEDSLEDLAAATAVDLGEGSEAESKGAVDFAEIQEALATPPPSAEPLAEMPEPESPEATVPSGSSPWMGILVLAVVGTLLGAIVGLIVVFS